MEQIVVELKRLGWPDLRCHVYNNYLISSFRGQALKEHLELLEATGKRPIEIEGAKVYNFRFDCYWEIAAPNGKLYWVTR